MLLCTAFLSSPPSPQSPHPYRSPAPGPLQEGYNLFQKVSQGYPSHLDNSNLPENGGNLSRQSNAGRRELMKSTAAPKTNRDCRLIKETLIGGRKNLPVASPSSGGDVRATVAKEEKGRHAYAVHGFRGGAIIDRSSAGLISERTPDIDHRRGRRRPSQIQMSQIE